MSHQALDFLDQLSSEDVDWLVGTAEEVTILAGGLLMQEGTVSGSVHFISNGLFEVSIKDGNGLERVVARIGAGQIVGEVSWLDGRPVSATIKALEGSSVLSLSTALLDERINVNAGFASRFYKALARVSAERLRASNIRHVTLENGNGDPALATSRMLAWSKIIDQMTGFKVLVQVADKLALESKGAISAQHKADIFVSFRELCKSAHVLMVNSDLSSDDQDTIGKTMQRELLPYIHLASSVERAYSKPRGYAGDYTTIEIIYNNTPTGVGRIGPLIEECFLREPAARSVRNRRTLLSEEIKQQHRNQQGPVRLTSLACGPARELFDVIDEIGAEALDITAIDIDQEALAMLRSRVVATAMKMRLEHANLIYLATGRQELDMAPQDLMYSIGLIDYFNDSFVVKLLDWIFDHLRPGGRVILGNFHPNNSSKALMDHILDWRLIHRDEAKMNELFSLSKFNGPCSRIFFEGEGINLFAEGIKR